MSLLIDQRKITDSGFCLGNSSLFIFKLLLVLLFVAVPLNSAYEIIAMLEGKLAYGQWDEALTPIYIKLLKDLFLIGSVCLAFFVAIRSKLFLWRQLLIYPVFLSLVLLFFAAISALVSSYFLGFDLVLYGFRGVWTVLFVFVGIVFCQIGERFIYRLFIGVFLINFLAQLIQYKLDLGFVLYGESRSPGIFLIPSISGAFSLLALYYSISFKNRILGLAALCSIFLANSSMAYIVLASYVSFELAYCFKQKGFILIFSSIILLPLLMYIAYTIRGEGLIITATARTEIPLKLLEAYGMELISSNMGIGTSQAVVAKVPGAFVADNLYIGLLVNIGILGCLVGFAFVVSTWKFFESKLLFFILMFYSLSALVFEMFPVAQILFLTLGMHIGNRHRGYFTYRSITGR